jgi:hypothetical protein
MGDAGLDVLEETRHERGELALVRLDEVVAQQRGERRRGRLVTGTGPDRDLGPLRNLRRFAPEIAQSVHEAALAQRPREARLDGEDQPRRPVTARSGSGRPVRLTATYRLYTSPEAARPAGVRVDRRKVPSSHATTQTPETAVHLGPDPSPTTPEPVTSLGPADRVPGPSRKVISRLSSDTATAPLTGAAAPERRVEHHEARGDRPPRSEIRR